MRALVAEDETRMAALLERGLKEEGYSVDVSVDGAEAVWMATDSRWLDLMTVSVLGGHPQTMQLWFTVPSQVSPRRGGLQSPRWRRWKL